ncbi:hypothetical protein DL95DRAFT_460967 [Leptodontidium sp. 2 PMI_412]|nr:hypothetical protein DL95DRAFT_460967 [Leptodontidium sp. 2 PMI_412]
MATDTLSTPPPSALLSFYTSYIAPLVSPYPIYRLLASPRSTLKSNTHQHTIHLASHSSRFKSSSSSLLLSFPSSIRLWETLSSSSTRTPLTGKCFTSTFLNIYYPIIRVICWYPGTIEGTENWKVPLKYPSVPGTFVKAMVNGVPGRATVPLTHGSSYIFKSVYITVGPLGDCSNPHNVEAEVKFNGDYDHTVGNPSTHDI